MRAAFAIRQAVLYDLDRIMEIEAASFGPEAYDRKLFAYYRKHCPALFLVAGRGRRVFGYMITCIRGGSRGSSAELVSVAIDPKRRQGGAASALLDSTLRRLRRRGITRLRLVVRVNNSAALLFYEK